MTTTIYPRAASGEADTHVSHPELVAGTELIGQLEGSGLKNPPYLVRRCDGQIVALSLLLFVIAGQLDGCDLETAAERVGRGLSVRIAPDKIAHVISHKLAPLGLVGPYGCVPPGLQPRDVLLGLRFRAALMPARIVRRIARALRPLYTRQVVIITLVLLAALDAWLTVHGIGGGLHEVIRTPTLMLGLVALTLASLIWHELGHATACRFGGARPGRIGIGIYLIWPAFYTDVTDSYRLSKVGRLRTDLGGIYFNGLFSLGAMGVFLATGYAPLLVLIASQQIIMLDQFTPWMRLDGYHVVSDLIGVTDLFERIRPVVASLRPHSPAHPCAAELKPWARRAVNVWVVTTVCALTALLVIVVIKAPGYATGGWSSIVVQARHLGAAAGDGNVAVGIISVIGIMLLSLPAVGVLYAYLSLCRGAGSRLALRRDDPALTRLATSRGLTTPPVPLDSSGGG